MNTTFLKLIYVAKKEIYEERAMYYCDTWSSQSIDVSELTEITDFSIASEILNESALTSACPSSRIHSTRSHKLVIQLINFHKENRSKTIFKAKVTQWWSFPWLKSNWTNDKPADDGDVFDNILKGESDDNISFDGTPV